MDKIINPNQVYNVKEAAELLGINSQTLLDYLRERKIVGRKIGEWKILGKALQDFLTTPGPELIHIEHNGQELDIELVEDKTNSMFDPNLKGFVDPDKTPWNK